MTSTLTTASSVAFFPTAKRQQDDDSVVIMSNRALAEDEIPVGGVGLALRFTLEAVGGIWFGVKGGDREEAYITEEKWKSRPVTVVTIHVPKNDYELYYAYANKLQWAINHDRPDLARYTPEEQRAFAQVSDILANTAVSYLHNNNLSHKPIQTEDYHLVGQARRMKNLGHQGKISIQMHTPLPGKTMRPMTSRDIFERTFKIFELKLPVKNSFNPAAGVSRSSLSDSFAQSAALPSTPEWTSLWLQKNKPIQYLAYYAALEDLTYFDAVTLQTEKDCRSFTKLLNINSPAGHEFPVFAARNLDYQGRRFKLMNAPISLPTDTILAANRHKLGNVAAHDIAGKWRAVKAALSDTGRSLMSEISDKTNYIIYSGAERGDFSKGMDARARSFYRYLRNNPDMHGQLQMLQIMIPTRTSIKGDNNQDNEYAQTFKEAKYWYDRANADFGTDDWKPAVIHTDPVPNTDAILLGQAVRFAGGRLRRSINAVYAKRDGMNLTVGESVIAQDHDYPSLIAIPKSIGAAQELGPLTLTYDSEDERAFDTVMEKAVDIYDHKESHRILRDLHQDMLSHLKKNDLMNWICQRLSLITDKTPRELRQAIESQPKEIAAPENSLPEPAVK